MEIKILKKLLWLRKAFKSQISIIEALKSLISFVVKHSNKVDTKL